MDAALIANKRSKYMKITIISKIKRMPIIIIPPIPELCISSNIDIVFSV